MNPTARTVAVAALLGLGLAMFFWKPWESGQAAPPPPGKTDFARDRAGDDAPPAAALKPLPFDADRALKYLKALCDLGPRVSGSDGMKRQQELLAKHFEAHGGKVARQTFQAQQRSRRGQKTEMTNLIVSYSPDRPRRVILCTHYDTRPFADQEPNRASWNRPFASANDGTSGAALFMELAHHLKELPAAVGVDLVFFDGEEFVFTGPDSGGDKYFLGSDHFADEYARTRDKLPYKYEAAVLFDLFAGERARYPIELNSWQSARPLVEQFWGAAQKAGVKAFQWERGPEVQDDHLALNRVGIPAIDVIDFDYPHWHKLTDTPDKVSGPQLADVAKVTWVWLQGVK